MHVGRLVPPNLFGRMLFEVLNYVTLIDFPVHITNLHPDYLTNDTLSWQTFKYFRYLGCERLLYLCHFVYCL
jgi:hypothetical protein